MQVAETAAGGGAEGGKSVGKEDPAAATKKRGRPKKGQPPPPHQMLSHWWRCCHSSAQRRFPGEGQRCPRKRGIKGRQSLEMGDGWGGGTVAKHAHTHFARTDGVSLFNAYRHGEATAMCSPEEMIKRLDQTSQDLDREMWTVTSVFSSSSSSSSSSSPRKRKRGVGEGGSSNTGRGS